METSYTTNNATNINVGFLPYLWGMETVGKRLFKCVKYCGSYRTYEEWKLFSFSTWTSMSFFGSYRTYEEWKHYSL